MAIPYTPTASDSLNAAPQASGAIPYDPNKPYTPPPPPQAPSPQLGQGAAGDFAGNAVRAITSPLVRTGGLIQSGLDQTFGRVLNAARGNGFTPTGTGQAAQQQANNIDSGASQSFAGKAGTLTGEVAPYLTPLGEGNAISKGTGLLSKGANYLAKQAPTMARDAGIATAQTGSPVQGAITGLTSGLVKGIPGALTKTPEQIAAKESGKITEMISPKTTAKEAQLAQTQGRFIEGKSPTLFRSGTADTIAPSKKTLSATDTIKKNIPNASKMSPSELYQAVDKNISETATKLRPQMEATPIKPETVQKLNTDWEALKKEQMANAPATEEANVAKRQLKFESLLQKSGSGNHADLWDTAINYDNSIPASVKKANSMSPESLQIQKDEWLQNRKILGDAIEKSSKPEFKQMSNMYEAKNGLLSQTKVEGAQPSKIKQWAKDNPKKSAALVGILGLEGAKVFGLDVRSLLP